MSGEIKIRNLGILAHVDAGKTTITERMLYESGRVRSLGSVDKGTAHTDYMDVERERGISVRAASTSYTWKGININLIDTPGHVDFSAEVERALRVLDCAVLVISAVEGVQAQAEMIWKALRSMSIPTIIFINKIDRVGSDASKVIEEIHRVLSPCAVPLQAANGEGTQEPQVENILVEDLKASKHLQEARVQLIECLADIDDQILEKYLNGENIKNQDIDKKLISLTGKGSVYPVLYGSAIKGIGVKELMDAVIRYLPSPTGRPELPLSGLVFKIDRDEAVGRIAHVRIYNGTVRARDMVYNVTRQLEEKTTQVRRVNVLKYEDTGAASAGEIAAICGMNKVKIGDVLGNIDGVPPAYHLSVPFLRVQAHPANEADYPRLHEALMELSDEDPALEVHWQQDKREIHLKTMGFIQIEVLLSILKSRFNLEASFGKVSVIYKETPSCSGEGFASYTMPKPSWAVVQFIIEPGERGSGVSYSSTVRTEYILERYQKQVEKTIPKALEQGLYGWEVTDIKITLIGGEYHVEHTCAPDFAIVTPMGIMDGLANTGTTLLEPMLKFKISAPEEAGGRILNDLVQMRGAFDTPVISKGSFNVEGIIPAATSFEYHIKLASMTGGRGTISTTFSGYKECPIELGAECPRRGVNPLDRAKYILYARNALTGN